ncbi:SDR family oxidoreductase [bacterium]|nr:SDR family oxidoreductase [bacterium]MBU1025903.1 SDR family oxidoreductase [bacterium]
MIQTKPKPVAIITGGAKGIGAAISSRLASDGYSLHVSYNESLDRFQALEKELMRQNVALSSTHGDISNPEVCRQIALDCIERHHRIDALILNAGKFLMGNLDELSSYEWNQLVQVNITSAVQILKNALPHMRKTGGNVVFLGTGSISNPLPSTNYPLYDASKAGLLVLMKSLSVSEANFGIRVNMVSPGMIDTGSLGGASIKKFSGEVPLQRLGKPEEVANVIAFLISDEASYINGVNLDVAGGWIRRY